MIVSKFTVEIQNEKGVTMEIDVRRNIETDAVHIIDMGQADEVLVGVTHMVDISEHLDEQGIEVDNPAHRREIVDKVTRHIENMTGQLIGDKLAIHIDSMLHHV